MIRIIYNPQKMELVFSVASILSKTSNHKYLIAPATASNIFEKSPKKLPYEKFELDEIDEIDDFEDINEKTEIPDKEEIILLGIRPENKEDNLTLINFFENYKDQIKLWVDDSKWDSSVLNYFKSDSDKIFVKHNSSCLQILTALGYPSSKEWLTAENALIDIDLNNNLAARIIKSSIVNRTIGANYSMPDDYNFYHFMLIVKELISKIEENFVTELENSFTDMISKTQKAKQSISDSHPSFKKAKDRGRPVGSLIFGEIDNYLDVETILDYGSEKFPWLFIIKFSLEGEEQILAKSKKIPIKDILKIYDKDGSIDSNNVLEIINSEILRHK